MKIELTGCYYAPSWETLQSLIRGTGYRDARLTRIRRIDNGCNYRALGEYSVEFVANGQTEQLTFIVR